MIVIDSNDEDKKDEPWLEAGFMPSQLANERTYLEIVSLI